jgi:hypothetical protein
VILQKIHQGLCIDNNTYGEVIKEILLVSMVRGMSVEFRHTETKNGHCAYSGFPILE